MRMSERVIPKPPTMPWHGYALMRPTMVVLGVVELALMVHPEGGDRAGYRWVDKYLLWWAPRRVRYLWGALRDRRQDVWVGTGSRILAAENTVLHRALHHVPPRPTAYPMSTYVPW